MTRDFRSQIASLLGLQKNRRTEGNTEQAFLLIERAEELFDSVDKNEFGKEYSRFLFEKAYLSKIVGKYTDSAALFLKSANVAKQGNDELRSWIGMHEFRVTEYLSGELSASEFYQGLLLGKQNLDSLQTVPDVDRGLLKNYEWNILERLATTAFEVGLTKEFNQWIELTLNHDVLVQQLGRNSDTYDFVAMRFRCHIHMAANENLECVKIFSSYIPVFNPYIPHNYLKPVKEEYLHVEKTWSEQFAKDFRDFARVILKCDFSQKEQAAEAIFLRGLELGEGYGNKRYILDIQNDLAELRAGNKEL